MEGRSRPAGARPASSPSSGAGRPWCTRTMPMPSRWAGSARGWRAGRWSRPAGWTFTSGGAGSGVAPRGSSRSPAPSPTCSRRTASRRSASPWCTPGSRSRTCARTPRLGHPRPASGSARGAPIAANVAALVPHKDHATLLRVGRTAGRATARAALGRRRGGTAARRARAVPRRARARRPRPLSRSPRRAGPPHRRCRLSSS